jgi:hypothetical protein
MDLPDQSAGELANTFNRARKVSTISASQSF